jgi:hypothetical protein
MAPKHHPHGLTANPATVNYPQITAVPAETYSNNVGLYGANSPVFICFAGARSARRPGSRSLNKKSNFERPLRGTHHKADLYDQRI